MAMVKKNVSYKILESLVHHANSGQPASMITTPKYRQAQRAAINAVATTQKDDEIFDFEDTKALFATVSTKKLLHSAATLNMAAIEPMVDLSLWVMNSRLMKCGLFKKMVMGTIRYTAYDHFVAGGDTVETAQTCLKLRDSGLRGMLDYGLEHANDNESCDQAAHQLIITAAAPQSLPPSSVSFVAVKVTAICPVYLLRRLSDLLRWEYKNSSFKLPWKQQTLPIFSESSPFYHTLQQPAPLNANEERDLELAHQRLVTICEKSFEGNVPVVIDAEDTSIQPAIDYMTYWASINYNEPQKPMVYGTIQAFLKDAGERMSLTKNAADKMGLPVGFKLVRGAYMSSERKLAHSLGVESPVHDTILDTHNCYNVCASYMLNEISNRPGGLVLATHNLDSGKLAAQKAREYGITKESEKLEFASLYGMAEAMTFGLRNAGFCVSKYLPFGPIDQIMPYLLRRAEENKGLLSSSSLDRQLMMKELKRRMKAY
ncbi:proline dehydrogenase 2, mitochondrial-like [Rutidosis leptorrhynchoides]|uniref:proline dehydrogenase 2, mitochondrial-like n=1 Tax=Rutidosis leptorrhynchoides TaxID=125765 RepID=UPI003A99FCE1